MFSDLKVKQTDRLNHLGLLKLQKMMKEGVVFYWNDSLRLSYGTMQIGSSILSKHKLAVLVPSCRKEKNHKLTGINLLAVP